ncbi:MAG: helix-turn-helix domain-containing protein, partial [Shewanella sp.]
MTQSHTEISEPTPAVTPEVIPLAGPILQAARLAKNLSVADVATRMHVRPSIVEDIERDCFDNIASPIYVKGYVKNFARIVGADEAAIKASIYAQLPSEEKPVMQSFSRKTTIKARDSRLMLVTWLIAFVLLALMVLWWVQKSNTDTLVDLSKPSIEEVAAIHSTPSLAHDADLLLATEADALAPGITAEQLQPEDTATTVDAPIDGAASSPINAGAQSAPAVTPSAVTAPATNTQSTAPVINSAANSAATPMITPVTP